LVFVFGSNESGVHGAGAARVAREKYGATWGCAYGRTGDAFGIPTKSRMLEPLSLKRIEWYVKGFLTYAREHPQDTYMVTRVGCGLAGFKDEDIAPMFALAPDNCQFDTAWSQWLPETIGFWGTY